MEFQQITEYLPFYCENINQLQNKDSPYIHEYRNQIVVYKFDRTFAIHMHDLLLYLSYDYINLYDGQRVNLMFQIVFNYYINYEQKNVCLGNLEKKNVWIVLHKHSNKFSPVLQTVFYDVVFINDQVKQYDLKTIDLNLLKLIELDFNFIKDIVIRLNQHKYSIVNKKDIQNIHSIKDLYGYLLKVIVEKYDQYEQKLSRGWFQFDQAKDYICWSETEQIIHQSQLINRLNIGQPYYYLSLQHQLIQQFKLQNYYQYFGELINILIQEDQIGQSNASYIIQSNIQKVLKILEQVQYNPKESNQMTDKIKEKFKFYYDLTIKKFEEVFSSEFKWTEPNKVIKENEDKYYSNFNASVLGFYLKNNNNNTKDYRDSPQFVNQIQESTWKCIFNETLELIKQDHQQEGIKQMMTLTNSLN